MNKKQDKKQKEPQNNEDEKLFAFLATFLSIIGFIIVLLTKKDNKYIMFYAKQSLVVFITSLILGILGGAFMFLPIIGWIIYSACNIVVVILWIISWIYSLSGEEKQVPIIGTYASKIKL